MTEVLNIYHILIKTMDDSKYEELRRKFFKVFASVPDPLRNEIVVIVEEDSYTWRTANAEIEHDTEKAKMILRQFQKIGVI